MGSAFVHVLVGPTAYRNAEVAYRDAGLALGAAPPRSGRRVDQAAGAGALPAHLVARVRHRAPVQRQAPAADAVAEVVAQVLQVADPGVEPLLPLPCQLQPVVPGRRAAVRQRREHPGDLRERDPDPLPDPDQRDPPERVAAVATLVAAGPAAGDQPLLLVEVQRRDGDATAGRQLADGQLVHDLEVSRGPNVPVELSAQLVTSFVAKFAHAAPNATSTY